MTWGKEWSGWWCKLSPWRHDEVGQRTTCDMEMAPRKQQVSVFLGRNGTFQASFFLLLLDFSLLVQYLSKRTWRSSRVLGQVLPLTTPTLPLVLQMHGELGNSYGNKNFYWPMIKFYGKKNDTSLGLQKENAGKNGTNSNKEK